MTVNTFESLPGDVLFEIFGYLSPVDILQSFLLLNKRLSRFFINEYFWHINIGDNTMSLSMFNNLCENVLKLIGARIISLRLTLNHMIGGWSLVSSSLKYHQTTLLRRLHLIDIEPHEFDKLLRHHFIKQLDTLLVDVTESNAFNYLEVEEIYLTKVCSQLPLLRTCRLPFDIYHEVKNRLDTDSPILPMSLPNLSNTNHLRSLTIGMHTSRFLQRLLSCIPLIKTLSIGVEDPWIDVKDNFDIKSLPAAVDSHLLMYLSRLRINCANNVSFHRIIALLSSVLGQLSHLSLILEAYIFNFGPLMISGDIIQQLCIDRLKPMATYSLNLLLFVEYDLEEKIIFNSFLKCPFTNRQQPQVFIQERDGSEVGYNCHCFMIYTLPYNGTNLSTHLFSTDLEKSCQMSINAVDLFPHANELFITGYKNKNYLSQLGNCTSSISSLVPWSLLTKITIDQLHALTAPKLEAILRMAYNVHTLQIDDDLGILPRAIVCNYNNLGTRVNQQIQSLDIIDIRLTLRNAQHFCTLLSNRLPNLKKLSFNIQDSYAGWHWKPLRIVDGKNKSTKRIVDLIYFLVDHLQQLASLHIEFIYSRSSNTPCFPHLIRRQLHQYPLSRPYRLRCSSSMIQIWL